MLTLKNFFLKSCPCEILQFLILKGNSGYKVDIIKSLSLTVATVSHISKKMVDYGLMTQSKEGRCVIYELTPYGITVAKAIKNINDVFRYELEEKKTVGNTTVKIRFDRPDERL